MIPAKIDSQPMDSVLVLNITIKLLDYQIFVIPGTLRCILGVSILIVFVDRMVSRSFF